MTEQELKENIKSQKWRLNNLYWIINENGQRVKFQMNAVQFMLFMTMWFLNIILKSRQHGITTFICIFFLDTCLFNSNIHAGIIAHNREDAEAFFKDKVKYAYDNLPQALRVAQEAESESARELSFPNNSVIRVGTSMRSTTLQYLHISEFGKLCAKYPEKAREVVTGSLNTVHKGQFIFIESTAEGWTGYFYEYCMQALELHRKEATLSPLDFKFFFFAWFDDPKNQIDATVDISRELLSYFDELKKKGINLTQQQKNWYALKQQTQKTDMKREYPSTPEEAFEATARNCFFADALGNHVLVITGRYGRLTEKRKKISFVIDNNGILETWRYPYFILAEWDGHHWTYRYVIGSDIGEGLGQDSSVAYVFDRHLRQIVARMHSNRIDSHRWGDRLHELSRYYENALIVPERNGAGITTINRLIDLKANIYLNETINTIGSPVTVTYGWNETTASKQYICGLLKAYLAEEYITESGIKKRKNNVFCKTLLRECATFIKDEEREKLGADEGCHDDHVIAAALCLAGDAYLPKTSKIEHPPTGWLAREIDKREDKSVWGRA